MNSEVTPAAATLTKTPNTGLYSSSRQVYARLECKQGKARLTSDPQPSRAKLAPIRAATDIANPTISTPAIASNRQTTAGLNRKCLTITATVLPSQPGLVSRSAYTYHDRFTTARPGPTDRPDRPRARKAPSAFEA